MTSSMPSEFHPEQMDIEQKRSVRVTSLECDIAKLIPIVAERLRKEGYGRLTRKDVAMALSAKTCENMLELWKG